MDQFKLQSEQRPQAAEAISLFCFAQRSVLYYGILGVFIDLLGAYTVQSIVGCVG